MKRILLLMMLFSILYADYVRDNATGIVTDDVTGLMWQDDAVETTVTWQGAIDRCETLSLGGYADWRLPNQNELRSLVDRSRTDPAVDPAFQNVVLGNYWSSTSVASYPVGAWCVDFYYGYANWAGKDYSYYVRCVRGGQ